MDNKEITIGRSASCDISLGENADFASHCHGRIFWDGSDRTQLMYKDTSTNGTIINNKFVHNMTIPLNHGDTILIAGKYLISWEQIDALLSSSNNLFQQTKILNSNNMAYCNKCGAHVDNWSSFCPNCGYPMGANTDNNHYQQVPPPQYSSQAYQQPQQRPMKPNSNMVWAILTTLFCCLPTGIYAIILASKVDSLYYAGRYDEAEEASNGAKKWSFISCIIAIIGILLYIIFIVLLAVGAATSY